jgi:tetratricopeptide (TPR) repeat protein
LGTCLALGLAVTNLASTFDLVDRRRTIEYLRRALEIAQRAAIPGPLMFSMSNLAGELINDGKLGEAQAMLEQAAEIGADLGPSWQGTYVDLWMARVRVYRGEFKEARQINLRAAEAVEQSGDRQGIGVALTNLSFASTLERHPEEDLDRLAPYLDGPQPADWCAGMVRSLAAWSTFEVGGDDAVDRAAALLSDVQQPDDTSALFLDACTARLRARQSRWNEAVETAERALTDARQAGLVLLEGILLDAYGEVLALKGDTEGARRRWEEAVAIFRDAEADAWVWRIERHLASLPS